MNRPGPVKCDICSRTLGDTIVDAITDFGPWAWMCPSCNSIHGIGFGTGVGQMYERVTQEEWRKVK